MEIESLREELLREFNLWAPMLVAGKISHIRLDVLSQAKAGEAVRSSAERDPRHLRRRESIDLTR